MRHDMKRIFINPPRYIICYTVTTLSLLNWSLSRHITALEQTFVNLIFFTDFLPVLCTLQRYEIVNYIFTPQST